MTGKLAGMVGAHKLRGPVCVTDRFGTTHQYATEEAAEAAWGDRADTLTHRRGAFWEGVDEPVVLLDESPGEEGRKGSGRRKRSGK